jgi:hypothetical protein
VLVVAAPDDEEPKLLPAPAAEERRFAGRLRASTAAPTGKDALFGAKVSSGGSSA